MGNTRGDNRVTANRGEGNERGNRVTANRGEGNKRGNERG